MKIISATTSWKRATFGIPEKIITQMCDFLIHIISVITDKAFQY